MNESILTSIKKLLNIEEDCTDFDEEVIVHINSVISDLYQLGVGSDGGFAIIDKDAAWKELLLDDKQLNNVKTYMYLRVKLVFDPPLSGSVISSMEREVNKLEWRINIAAESSNAKSEVKIQNE